MLVSVTICTSQRQKLTVKVVYWTQAEATVTTGE